MTFPLVPILASGGLGYAFRESTVEGKAVIFCLLIASIFSWSVTVTKFLQVRRARKNNALFLREFRRGEHPLGLFQRPIRYDGSPLFNIYRAGCGEAAFQLTGESSDSTALESKLRANTKLTPLAMASIRSALERAVPENALALEKDMVLLATAVSGAPFLGLLGTVWGVMDTFTGVALAGKATLQAMAPGVSGALITTVTGLLVAIPAMFAYNFLVATLRALTVEMDNFAAEFASNLEHQFVDPHSR
jgi:biopolymer transport protein ExbB/TolQ